MTTTTLLPLVLAAMLAVPGRLGAQSHDHSRAPTTTHADMAPQPAGPHLLVTPPRSAAPGDSARAAALVATLRDAIARYRDVRVAEADGFRMFAPAVRRQRIYHYTDRRAAALALFRFDPARPTSLLYRPRSDGTLELVGAMYTAPRGATLDELDARVPLAVASWHQHVNLCLPKAAERERMLERRDGRPLVGPGSPIASRAACEASGGRFRARALGWMVHVNVFAGDDPAVIWADSHRHGVTAGSPTASPASPPMP